MAGQFIGTSVSSLCSTLPRPLILTGLLREILTRHFAERPTIEDPALANLIWASGELTKVLIEAVHTRVPQLTELRPAILIKRNALQNVRLGIADLNQGPPADRHGQRRYNTFWVGSHTIFCMAHAGAQVETLATEVVRELHHFHPVIRESALLHRFEIREVGPISELEESRETFVVPVTVAYAYQDTWVVSQEVPTLRSLRLSFLVDC